MILWLSGNVRPKSKILIQQLEQRLFLLFDTRSLIPRERMMSYFRPYLWISCPSWPIIISYATSAFLSHASILNLRKVVRRVALSSLNSAARTKPHLIRDHLTELLPNLFKETVINSDLIRTVQMGPWTQKFDDGLETRKTAYETMYTLVCTVLNGQPNGP